MPMCDRKIEREVQKHILGFLDSGLSLSPGVRAKYSAEDHLKVLLKTAFEQKYIQGTARRLRSNWELQSVNSAVLCTARRMGLFRKQVICAIDSSDTEYYGETDTLVAGGKQKNGTNGFHRISTTVPVTGGIKFDLGMVVRKPMDSDTGAIRSLIDSSSACVDAWLYLLDRGFRSAENRKLFDDMGKRYLMPYPLDDRIEREIEKVKGLAEVGASRRCPCNIHEEERYKAIAVRIQLPSRHILRKTEEKEVFEEHTLFLHRAAPPLPCGAAHAHNNGQPVGTLDTGYNEMGKV